MHLRPTLRSTLLVTLLIGPTVSAHAADEPIDEKARAEEFRAFASREAEMYTFRPADPHEQGSPFTLKPEPILRWTNPMGGSIHGGVYVWTAKGRPEVVTSINKWYSPFRHRANEFLSLSLGTFVGGRDGQADWMPSRAGVELKPVPESPAPAGTPAHRLRQMRDLAKEFKARQTDRTNIDRDMRPLAQPIYRYEKTEGDLIDGCMFVFVLGTDPEAFLLIEARRVDGIPQWQYALARMNSIHLRVSYRGREVWSVPTLPWAMVQNHREPYTTFRFDPVELEKLEGR